LRMIRKGNICYVDLKAADMAFRLLQSTKFDILI
jgi:hypothetical protein